MNASKTEAFVAKIKILSLVLVGGFNNYRLFSLSKVYR
jgi:hypothetical protein